jgi:3-hydroxybutyryl-CoA dehydrogenase
MQIKKVGVIGCGLMGSGIAQVCAQTGYQVVVSEINEDLLNKGLKSIEKFLVKSVQKGKLTEQEKNATLSRIKGTTSLADFFDRDLVIEAVVEDMGLKQSLFTELDATCPSHTILATNTSCLSVMDIAAVTKRPDKVLGLHFFNPATIMKLLEVVRTISTSDETMEMAEILGTSLGKTVVITKDTPGFIVNRLSVAFTLDAIRMLEAGIATKEDIDKAVTQGLNHPMGPLELADFAGLDTLYHIAVAMYDESKDLRFAPPILLKKMVKAGWLGRKTGKGFYDYEKHS